MTGLIEMVHEVDGYVHDGETFCWKCLPNKPTEDESRITEFIGFDTLTGESDCFENCQVCCVPLKNSLTSDGVRYELEKISQSLVELRAGDTAVELWRQSHENYRGTWYEGEPRIQSLRDNALRLLDYTLTRRSRAMVEYFLQISAPVSQELGNVPS